MYSMKVESNCTSSGLWRARTWMRSANGTGGRCALTKKLLPTNMSSWVACTLYATGSRRATVALA